jgi:lysophospholipase L1-like esterase
LPDALAQRFDLTVLVFGVNDATHLTSLARWQAALAGMAQALNATGARVVFTAVPPLQHFSALPWLLRQLLGLRAALLDRRLSQVVAQVEAERHAVVLEFSAEYLACDGYHPSALGYRVWAEGLALSLAPGARSSD